MSETEIVEYRRKVLDNPRLLDDAPYEIKNDKELMLELVKKDNLWYLEKASKELLESPEFGMEVVKINPFAIEYLDWRALTGQVCMEAVRKDDNVIGTLKRKSERDFVAVKMLSEQLEALKTYKRRIQTLSEQLNESIKDGTLINNKELINKVLNLSSSIENELSNYLIEKEEKSEFSHGINEVKKEYFAPHVTAAVNYWANSIKKPSFDNGDNSETSFYFNIFSQMSSKNSSITDEQINKFKEKLYDLIMDELLKYGYCSFGVDYNPPMGILAEASKSAGIEKVDFSIKTHMHINDMKVEVNYNDIYTIRDNEKNVSQSLEKIINNKLFMVDKYINISEEKRNDKGFAIKLAGTFSSSDCLGFFSDEIKDDPEVVFAFIKETFASFGDASDRLRNNKDFVLKCIKENRLVYFSLPERMKDDKEIAIAALEDGLSLEHLSERLKDDEEVVLKAVQEWAANLEYASERLKDDKEIVLEAVQKRAANLEYASERLKDDKEVVLKAVQKRGANLEHASERLKDDKEVVLKAVQEWGENLEYASERLKDDKEIVLEAVKKSAKNIEYASERIKTDDRDVVLEVVKQFYGEYSIHDYQPWYKVWRFCRISDKLKDDKELMFEAIIRHPDVLTLVSERLRDDPEFMLHAIANGANIRYASDRLKNDPEFMLHAIANGAISNFASDRLKNDPEFMKKAITIESNRMESQSISRKIERIKYDMEKMVELGKEEQQLNLQLEELNNKLNILDQESDEIINGYTK